MPLHRAISRICNFSRRRMRNREHGSLSMKRAFGMVYFLGMLAEVVIRVPHERRRRETRMMVESVDWSERSLLGLMFVGMFFIPLVYTFTSRLDGADCRLPREARESAGGVGMIILAMSVWLVLGSPPDLWGNWVPSPALP